MKENSINIAYPANPVLLDKVLNAIQAKLTSKLAWLDYAFGRSRKIVSYNEGGSRDIFPAVYNNGGEYLSLLPNDNYGNFSWFDIYDPQQVEVLTPGRPKFSVKGALIFWYNQETIYDNSLDNSESIKAEIISLLTTPGFMPYGAKLGITSIYDNFENIYKGYSIEQIYTNAIYGADSRRDKQYFMYPYGGLRIEFNLTYSESCQL